MTMRFRAAFCFFSYWLRSLGTDIVDWVRELGGFVSAKLQIRSDHHGGRGVFVTSNVDKGEILVSVPLGAMLLGERAVNTTPCANSIQAFFQQMQSTSQADRERTHALFSMMVLVLSLFEAGRDRSDWPHLSDLLAHWRSRQQQRFPLLWPKWALREIEGTTASSVFSVAARGVEREFAVLQQSCPEIAGKSSLQAYKQAWALVNSRVLTYPGSRLAGPQAALVPLFDLVNHHLPVPRRALLSVPEVQGHLEMSLGRFGTEPPGVQADGSLHLWLREAAQEVEVTDVYGLHSNEEMLWTSGFTVPWIHNLTCLTRSRLALTPEELPDSSLNRPGFGSEAPAELLAKLRPFLHFNLGGCSASRATPRDQLRPVMAFLRAWVASTRASSPANLKATCGLAVPQPLQPFLQPFVVEQPTDGSWSMGSCKYLKRADEILLVDFLLGALDEKASQMPGGSLLEEEAALKTKTVLKRDAAVIRRDEKFLLHELTVWLRSQKSAAAEL